MANDLMAKESLDNLGFKELSERAKRDQYEQLKTEHGEKESKGFVAGTGVKPAAGYKPSTPSYSWWPWS